MTKINRLTVLLVFLSGCSGSNNQAPPQQADMQFANQDSLLEETWVLKTIETSDGSFIEIVNSPPSLPLFTLDFNGESTGPTISGQLSGSFDCNGFSASYNISDSVLLIDTVSVSDNECVNPSAQAGTVSRALFQQLPIMIDINSESLSLSTIDNDVLIYIQQLP